jgi:hypothetical protein
MLSIEGFTLISKSVSEKKSMFNVQNLNLIKVYTNWYKSLFID